MKHLIRLASLCLLLALVLNFRWVHAATATVFAEPCNPNMTTQAQARVADLFGNSNSQPIVRCTKQTLLGLDVSYGRTNFAPLLPAVILIGPEGENVDVIAHEWVHAEVSLRLGFLKRAISLPTWVDEGLAMQVDQRQDYSPRALARYKTQPELHWPTTDAISNTRFFAASDPNLNPNQGKLHYAISRCAVGTWVAQRNNWLNLLTQDLPTALTELTDKFEECK